VSVIQISDPMKCKINRVLNIANMVV